MRSFLATQSAPRLQPEVVDPWPRERESAERRMEAFGPVMLLLAAFCAVIVFFPAEGRVAGPLHEFFDALLGRASFMLPLALAVVGVIQIVRGMRPDVRLPRRRFAGVVFIGLVAAASEQLIASDHDGTGLLGRWLSASLLDLFGGPVTTILLVVLLGAGTVLAFDLKWPIISRRTPDAES